MVKLNNREIQQIEDIIGADAVSIRREACAAYENDVASLPSLTEQIITKRFDVIAQPSTVESLQKLILYVREKKIPIVPRGSGTSGWGGAIPTKSGICINFNRMNKVLHFDSFRNIVTVESGIIYRDLLMFLEKMGETLPIYPSSATAATVGGFVASGGIGIGSAMYGEIEDQILGIEAILANGKIIRIGNLLLDKDDIEISDGSMEWLKENFNYKNPLKALIATYGTIGLITKVTLRTVPMLQVRPFACAFHDMDKLMHAAIEILEKARPFNIRFLADNYTSKLKALIGHEIEMNEFILTGALMNTIYENDDSLEVIKNATEKTGGIQLSEERAEYYWDERFFPLRIKRYGPSIVPSEVLIPLDRLNEFYKEISSSIVWEKFAVEGTISRDGKTGFLAWVLDDERNKYSYLAGWYRPFDITARAVHYGGRPYAIGLWNAKFSEYFYGEDLYYALRGIKYQVDPNNLLNPMKVFGGRITPGRKTKIAGFLTGLFVTLIAALAVPQIIGWTALSEFLANPIIPILPIPSFILVGIAGGIFGFFVSYLLTLNLAFSLALPFLRLMGKIWKK